MVSTPDNKFAEAQIESCLSNLLSEAGVSPSAPPTTMKTSRASRSAGWRYVAFASSLLTASIAGAAWWWAFSAHNAMGGPPAPAPLTQPKPQAIGPTDAGSTAVVVSSELAQQLQPMTHDLAALRRAVEQLKVKQEQLVRDNENVASQLNASQQELARNNSMIDEIKATQVQMARESRTLTERLNASQEQLGRVIADASKPDVIPEQPKVSPEEPKEMPKIPLPRPRQTANVAQTQKPVPTPSRPEAKKPQPSLAWPWSTR
jgi:outer membrane murein-binding lipoprotein Lpp